MKICTQCVLPETFPGISFDDRGVCSLCRRSGDAEAHAEQRGRYRDMFLDLVREVRGKYQYDALIAYSGGKDSTYTMKLLQEEYRLRLLAVTVDHGFTSPAALANIAAATGRLDIDHYAVRPGAESLRTLFTRSLEEDVYPLKALERASAICNSCMHLVKSILLKLAIEMDVPMIVYGWSPGQAPLRSSIFATNPSMLKMMQGAARAAFERLVQERLHPFLLDERHFARGEKQRFPTLVHPLAFLDYDESAILETVAELGWRAPRDTGAHSSNCLLNDFAIAKHLEQHGFHPYAFEIAGLVRSGYMTRGEGLERLEAEPDRAVARWVEKRLRSGERT